MKMTPHLIAAAAAVVFAAAGFDTATGDTTLSPPHGFRQWFHVNTQIIDKDSPFFGDLGGMNDIYLSPGGVPMLKNGRPYPDGTVFVDDLHEFTIADGSYVEGKRKVLAVMVRDAKKYAATGGWGFQAWAEGDAKRPLVTDAARQCFGCHTQRFSMPRPEEQQYIFSSYIP